MKYLKIIDVRRIWNLITKILFMIYFFIHLRKFPMHFYSLQQSNLSGYFFVMMSNLPLRMLCIARTFEIWAIDMISVFKSINKTTFINNGYIQENNVLGNKVTSNYFNGITVVTRRKMWTSNNDLAVQKTSETHASICKHTLIYTNLQLSRTS